MKQSIQYALVLFAVAGSILFFAEQHQAYAQEEGDVAQRIYVQTADNASVFVNTVSAAAPGIIGAIIVLVIGYFVSKYIGKIVQKKSHDVLLKTGYDRTDSEKETGNTFDTSQAIGSTIRWFVFLFFVVAAVDQMEFNELSQALEIVWLWFPNVIAAIVAVILGVMIITHASKWAEQTLSKNSASQVKTIVKALVFTIVAAIALIQLGIGVTILPIVIAAISISVAIAIGLGLKDIVPVAIQGVTNPNGKLKLGQKVRVGDIKGTVTATDMFSVTLINDKEESIIIPAKELSIKPITVIKNSEG